VSGSVDIAGPIVGAVAMSIPVVALHLVSPASMGFGDVKAAMVLGGAVGTVDWRLGAVALCLAALTGSIAGVVMRRATIPFGPFLVAGALVACVAADPIIDAMFTDAMFTDGGASALTASGVDS
jgi:leader peptidase (prepilin peptidase)/N-methyltransferase